MKKFEIRLLVIRQKCRVFEPVIANCSRTNGADLLNFAPIESQLNDAFRKLRVVGKWWQRLAVSSTKHSYISEFLLSDAAPCDFVHSSRTIWTPEVVFISLHKGVRAFLFSSPFLPVSQEIELIGELIF